MKTHSKSGLKKEDENKPSAFAELFRKPPTVNQKAWSLIHDFLHMVLTRMEQKKIKRVDLAKKLNIKRSAISKMFNKEPNMSIKKMVEIADAVGLDLELSSIQMPFKQEASDSKVEYKYKYISLRTNSTEDDWIGDFSNNCNVFANKREDQPLPLPKLISEAA